MGIPQKPTPAMNLQPIRKDDSGTWQRPDPFGRTVGLESCTAIDQVAASIGGGGDDDDDDDGANSPAFPPLVDAPTSSSIRKEQVRAALFHKMQPIRLGR